MSRPKGSNGILQTPLAGGERCLRINVCERLAAAVSAAAEAAGVDGGRLGASFVARVAVESALEGSDLRPMPSGPHCIGVRVTAETAAAIDAHPLAGAMSRSALVRALLAAGLGVAP